MIPTRDQGGKYFFVSVSRAHEHPFFKKKKKKKDTDADAASLGRCPYHHKFHRLRQSNMSQFTSYIQKQSQNGVRAPPNFPRGGNSVSCANLLPLSMSRSPSLTSMSAGGLSSINLDFQDFQDIFSDDHGNDQLSMVSMGSSHEEPISFEEVKARNAELAPSNTGTRRDSSRWALTLTHGLSHLAHLHLAFLHVSPEMSLPFYRLWYQKEYGFQDDRLEVLASPSNGNKKKRLLEVDKEREQSGNIKFNPEENLSGKNDARTNVEVQVMIRAGHIDPETGNPGYVLHYKVLFGKSSPPKLLAYFTCGRKTGCVVAGHDFDTNDPVAFVRPEELATDELLNTWKKEASEKKKKGGRQRRTWHRIAYLEGPDGRTQPYVMAHKVCNITSYNSKWLKSNMGMIMQYLEVDEEHPNCAVASNGCIFVTEPVKKDEVLRLAKKSFEDIKQL